MACRKARSSVQCSQYSAHKLDQVRRNRTHSPLHQRGQEESSIKECIEVDQPSTAPSRKGRRRLPNDSNDRRSDSLLTTSMTPTTDDSSIVGMLTISAWALLGRRQRQKRSSSDSGRSCTRNSSWNSHEEQNVAHPYAGQRCQVLGLCASPLRHSNTKHTLDRNGYRGRSINGDIGLKVPQQVVRDKCKRYRRKGKTIHRAELLNESDYTILATYQLEYRGMVNYYRMAFNLHTLQKLKWVMEQSLTKTLAAKHKLSVRKVYQKYQAELDSDGKIYKGLQVTVPREGKKPLIATWGGIPLIWDINTSIEDQVKHYAVATVRTRKAAPGPDVRTMRGNSRNRRIEVYHIRALKDLEKYTGREKPQWVQIMASRKRKTLVLCHTCHMDIQYGRPHRNKVSRSRTDTT